MSIDTVVSKDSHHGKTPERCGGRTDASQYSVRTLQRAARDSGASVSVDEGGSLLTSTRDTLWSHRRGGPTKGQSPRHFRRTSLYQNISLGY